MTIRLLLGALLAALPVATAGALAQGPAGAEPLGSFRDWESYKLTRDGETTCYAVSEPTQSTPKGANRDRIFFAISHWPARNARAEPSIVTGYTYRPGSKATVSIGKARFDFFTQGDGAWIRDPKDEKRFLTAIKSGTTMVVKGTSNRGTVTTDRYSLLGVSAALDKIDAACK